MVKPLHYSARPVVTLLSLLGTLSLIAPMPAPAQDTEPTAGNILFILDGSGSMWGQIEGQPKITIAKDVMTRLIQELPTNLNAGLEVYGHRSKGDCDDIEVMVPVGAGDRTALIRQIESISPKGKTPITQAFRQAADHLRTLEEATTVVLVSDGKETCEGDPCTLVRELREQGVKVKVHVVGFDVDQDEREQLVCIAEAGGGRYFSADSTEQLNEALIEVKEEVVAEAAPAPNFIAVTSGSEQPVAGPVQWTFINTETEEVQILDDQPAALRLELAPGAYEVYVTAGADTGEARITVAGQPDERFTVPLGQPARSDAFTAPRRVAAGSVMRFDWDGPNAPNDRIFIVEPTMDDNRYLTGSRQYHATDKGTPALLTAPATPGNYEIRYFSYNNGTVLKRASLEVIAPEVTLDAPGTVSAGTVMKFPWSGPDAPDDRIFISEPGTEKNHYPTSSRQYHATEKGTPALLTAPATPGNYEIRYFSYNNGSTLTRLPLTVTLPDVELDAPRTVGVGTLMEFSWSGPNAPDDRIFISEPGTEENRYPTSSRQYHATDKGTPALLTAPAKPGAYEIRYYSYNNGTLLAKRALVVR